MQALSRIVPNDKEAPDDWWVTWTESMSRPLHLTRRLVCHRRLCLSELAGLAATRHASGFYSDAPKWSSFERSSASYVQVGSN